MSMVYFCQALVPMPEVLLLSVMIDDVIEFGDSSMDIYLGHLINWELQKSSSLIGQLAPVHNCDWLLKKNDF